MKRVNNFLWAIFIVLCSLLAGCKKEPTDKEQLPAATQTGANTFGCLINGKIYIPKGSTGTFQSNFQVIVDPGFYGNFDVRTFRINDGIQSGLSFSCSNVISTGFFPLPDSSVFPNYLKNLGNNDCYFISSANNYKYGFLKITRYDLNERIFSGEFQFNLYDSSISCDTIKITQGRFDAKL